MNSAELPIEITANILSYLSLKTSLSVSNKIATLINLEAKNIDHYDDYYTTRKTIYSSASDYYDEGNGVNCRLMLDNCTTCVKCPFLPKTGGYRFIDEYKRCLKEVQNMYFIRVLYDLGSGMCIEYTGADFVEIPKEYLSPYKGYLTELRTIGNLLIPDEIYKHTKLEKLEILDSDVVNFELDTSKFQCGEDFKVKFSRCAIKTINVNGHVVVAAPQQIHIKKYDTNTNIRDCLLITPECLRYQYTGYKRFMNPKRLTTLSGVYALVINYRRCIVDFDNDMFYYYREDKKYSLMETIDYMLKSPEKYRIIYVKLRVKT